jgi:hypothetical protein
MEKEYSNKYGFLKFMVGDKQPISTLCSDNFPNHIFFDLETAEKIALITENKKIQICFKSLEKMYLVYHFTISEVGLCLVKKLEFSSPVIPSKEIERFPTPCFYR